MKRRHFILLFRNLGFAFLLLLAGNKESSAQSNPAPWNLSAAYPTLTTWSNTAPAGTYPTSMFFHTCGVSHPTLSDPTISDWVLPYSGTLPRIYGLGTSGIGFQNNAGTPSIGAAILGLNTTGKTNIFVTWQSRAILFSNNVYGLRLQYRVSTVSIWQDVPGPVEYVCNGTSINLQNFSINLSTATANAVDNRPNMQIRWKFYYISGVSTNGCQLTLDEVNVSATNLPGDIIATGAVTGSPYCLTPSTGISVSVPFTYTPPANFTNGSTNFTAQLSNSIGIFTSPTDIGTITSNATGSQTIAATIPANTGTGIGYRIRVVSDAPSSIGSDNGTDLIIRLSPGNVTNVNPLPANLSATISWTLPSPCFNEVMVVAYTASISGTPSGNGSAYTANTVYGLGTNFLPGFIVYKGGGSSVTVTNLVNGAQYFFKVFVRYGTDWSGGIEVDCVPGDGTILKRGDFAVVGVNAANDPCGGYSDEISFVCFKNITNNTTLDITDNGWNRLVANRFGNTEGVIRCTRTGGTITAGTVITFRFSPAAAVSPDASWAFANISGTFALNSGGEQFFFMQSGTWNNGTANAHDAQYINGTVLFSFNTNTSWVPFANSTQQSGAYPFLDCYSVAPSAATDFMKYTGDLSPKTQRNWVDSINDPTKWTRPTPAGCAAYNTLLPIYASGVTFTILAGGYQRGKWIGSKSNNWYTCDNWEDFVIPDVATDVTIPLATVPFNCRFMKDTTAYCRDLTILGNSLESDSTATSILRVHGNFLMSAGTLNFTFGNISAPHGSMYFKGNWNNYDENAFKQGNGTIIFNGGTTQNIFCASGIEKFYNISINNSANVNLGNNITAEKLLNFTNGKIVTSSNEVYVSDPSVTAITGNGLNSYVIGNLRRQVNTSILNSYDFPVGSASNYELATINILATGNSGFSNLIVDFKNPTTGTTPNPALCFVNGTSIGDMLNEGNWTILPNAFPTGVNFDLTLNQRGQSNGVSPDARYGIISRDNSLDDWLGSGSGFGTHDNATQSTNSGTVVAKRTGITNVFAFGDFNIGFGSGALPVELLFFQAQPLDHTVKLLWQTASETNNDFFVVERSKEGVHFQDILTIDGAGNSNSELTYISEDTSPYNGLNYYRLRQVDFNGDIHYSEVVAVRFEKTNNHKFSIFPNPVTNQAIITFDAINGESNLLEVYDAMGKQVQKIMYSPTSIDEQIFIYPVADLIPGIYFLRIGSDVVKFVKQ